MMKVKKNVKGLSFVRANAQKKDTKNQLNNHWTRKIEDMQQIPRINIQER